MIGNLLNLIRKKRHKRYLQTVAPFITIGNSHLLPGFRLNLLNPVAGKKYVRIGEDTMLDCQINFESPEGEVVIGDRVYVGNSTIISHTRVEFGNDIFVGWGSYFYDHDSHSSNYIDRRQDLLQQLGDYRRGNDFRSGKDWSVVKSAPIKVCSDAWIGMNCIILKGVVIGEGAIVAAGSVVTKDVPPWSVVAGNPAVFVKTVSREK